MYLTYYNLSNKGTVCLTRKMNLTDDSGFMKAFS